MRSDGERRYGGWTWGQGWRRGHRNCSAWYWSSCWLWRRRKRHTRDGKNQRVAWNGKCGLRYPPTDVRTGWIGDREPRCVGGASGYLDIFVIREFTNSG